MKFAGDAMVVVWQVEKAPKNGTQTLELDQLRSIAAAKATACATNSIELLR